MAEEALFDLAGKVLQLMGSLILKEVKLASSIKTDIEYLTNTVSTIQAVILDAEKQSSHSHQIKDWLSKLKDVLHDADDLLDDFSTHVLRYKLMSGNKMKNEVRIFFSSSNQLAFSLKKGHELKAIRKRLDAITKDKENFQFSPSFVDVEPQVMNRSRDTYSFVLEDEVIGRENDKKEIIERLFNDNVVENTSIIPIVGFGGLGKTTLAQLVFNDENVKKKFELKLWICISDIFEVKRIVKEILEQLTKRKHEESLRNLQKQLEMFQKQLAEEKPKENLELQKQLKMLQKQLREELEQLTKRKHEESLAILQKQIEMLQKLLTMEKHKESIEMLQKPLTMEKHKESIEMLQKQLREELKQLVKEKHEESLETLQKQLREEFNGKKYLLVLDDLWNEDNNKWLPLRDLLMVGAKGSRIIVTTRSESVARIIGATSWHALRGLPKNKAWSLFVKIAFEQGQLPENQAFISMGKEIVEKCGGVPLAIRTIASLLRTKTLENEWRSFKDYGLSKIILEEENHISSTLKLSYDYLPSYLKQCFAYCRLFPKDYKIDVETLINLWAAQGFIKLSNPMERVEDVGKEYFMVLLRRCFFQDVEKDECDTIAYCKMHDLMHDLATLVAGKESTMLTSSEEYNGKKFRHVSVDLEDSSRKISIFKVKGMKIRTILIASVGGELGNLTCDTLISNLNYLRTLDLSCLGLHVMPHSIGELSHLRYLDLSENIDIEFLPNSITKLLNLQTLKLHSCESLKELPRGLKKLVNLRHLDVSKCLKLTHMPLGLGHLTSLEILPWFVVRKRGSKARPDGGLSELTKLSNLGGSLLIGGLGHGKDDMEECKATNMKQKQHLQELDLWWGRDDIETECYDDTSLEWLRPHPNLKAMRLCNYMGVRIPSWVSSLTNLVRFHLYDNKRLQHLPPLNQLPFLKAVSLGYMYALEYILDEDSVSNVLGASSSSSKTPFFPSLSSLELKWCPKLKGWWRNSDDDNEPHHLLLLSFPPSLSTLSIINCPNLTYMPPFPYLKERLELSGCSWKVLEQTMKMGATTTSTYFPLSQLQTLNLWNINDLESLPEEELRNLVSLRELSIGSCDGLVSLPWIGSLTSLHTLDILGCPNLTSLPQEIRNLTSLKELRIRRCPLLGQRCKRQIGEDWPFIAHVPTVIVDWKNQQEETISSESESESESVCLLPEGELILQQPLTK